MISHNDTFILSKRGWLTSGVIAAFFLFFTMTGLHLFQFISGALLIAVLTIFRNPERNSVTSESDSIISNVDGIVLSLEDIKINDQTMTKVTIMNSLWDVSILRAPFDAVVEGIKIRHGATLPIYNPMADTLNEKAVISFRSSKGEEVYIEHLSEQSCFPIAVDMEKSQKLKEGNRYGFLAKGRTVLYIPKTAQITVNAGNSLRAGESIIGHFKAA